jgi:hypothetical protein
VNPLEYNGRRGATAEKKLKDVVDFVEGLVRLRKREVKRWRWMEQFQVFHLAGCRGDLVSTSVVEVMSRFVDTSFIILARKLL